MPAYNVAKEMQHPSGSKVMLAFSSEDEREILLQFAEYRREHQEAHLAAIEGRVIPPKRAAEPVADDMPVRRGPGRPPNERNV